MSNLLKGEKEMMRTLNALDLKLQTKINKKALNSAGQVIVAAMRKKLNNKVIRSMISGAEFNVGQLKKDMGKVIRKGSSKRDLYVAIGPIERRRGFYAWAWWLEYGTLAFRETPPSLTKKRTSTGSKFAGLGLGIKKQPFMRPAIAEASPKAFNKMASVIKINLEK